jgi:hypothetical protein
VDINKGGDVFLLYKIIICDVARRLRKVTKCHETQKTTCELIDVQTCERIRPPPTIV